MLLLFGTLLSTNLHADEDQVLTLAKMGVLYVGGREIDMQASGGRFGGDGQTQIVDQAPVHYLIPPKVKRQDKLPVIMVPGMGLTSYLYLSTPDGRPGWAQLFAQAGYPVYVFDEPGNAVSGFDVSGFQAGTEAESPPRFMLWSNETVWRRWGIGSAPGKPFADTRYPVKHIEQLYASMTPVFQGGSRNAGQAQGRGRFRRRFSGAQTEQAPTASRRGASGRFNAEVKAKALVALLDRIGPAILIVHSASGSTGFAATRIRSHLVKALVAVEIVGAPTEEQDIEAHFKDKQFIAVFGDHFESRPMAGRQQACETMAQLMNAAGGKAEVIALPKQGIKGNTHLLMQDNNNHVIAEMIMKRLTK